MSEEPKGETVSARPPVDASVVIVSVVIVSWNTRELLRTCLASMAGEVERGTAEVIVVDNGSADGSAAMVADEFKSVTLIALEENVGFGRAVNLGVSRAGGRWLAVANADTALRPGALQALIASGERDPAAGAIAPRLVLPGGSTQHSVFMFPTLSFTLVLNLGVSRLSRRLADRLLLIGAWNQDLPRRVPWAVAAFLLVRRDAWDAVGGFDEHQWMYAEDLDLGWRLHRAGWATRYEPAGVVDHHSAASTTQAWGAGLTARWQRSTYAWMLRRRGWPLTRLVAAINVLGCGVRWAALTPAARIAPARWSQRAHAARWWMGLHAQGLASSQSLKEHR